MRTLVIGDIHGAHKALIQTLERANYDPAYDRIITLGDVSDSWIDTFQVVEFLTTQCNPEVDIHMIGNHDEWTETWMRTGVAQPIWTKQGGHATMLSYQTSNDGIIPDSHRKFFREQKPYFLDHDLDFVFVHAGWYPAHRHIDSIIVTDDFWWDRDFYYGAIQYYNFHDENISQQYTPYKKVFIGHTTVGAAGPHRVGEVWNLDTGAGWDGVLTIMDAETEEFWQSDKITDLYPNVQGRQ